MAKFSFGNRVCEQWNHLPGDVVSSSSVNIFKGRLENYLSKLPGKTIGEVLGERKKRTRQNGFRRISRKPLFRFSRNWAGSKNVMFIVGICCK